MWKDFLDIFDPSYFVVDHYMSNMDIWITPSSFMYTWFIDGPWEFFFFFIVYKWEGFGYPHSNGGSLSSLDSFGHVDDLELSKTLIDLANQQQISNNISSSAEEMSSIFEDEYDIPQQYFMDSWVWNTDISWIPDD